MPILPFISDGALLKNVKWVLSLAEKASKEEEREFYKNAVDPFSAVFDAARQNIPLGKWTELEKTRQGQKALQNRLGDFHQAILGSISGWIDLEKGHLIDIKNDSKKIIAEVKNKYNTTKGSDKIQIYDNLKYALENGYKGYKAYYVEVIPKNKNVYDKPFTPSDNKTSTRRPVDTRINVIDGKSFYALASGYPNALRMLYDALPTIIGKVLSRPTEEIVKDSLFNTFFEQAYP